MPVNRFPRYGPLIVGLFFSLLLIILLGFLIRWFRSRQRTEAIRNLQSIDQFPPYVSKQLVFLTHPDISLHLFADCDDAPTHFSSSAKSILPKYIIIVLGMSILSFVSLAIYHSQDSSASMTNGDTLTILLLTVWGFSPVVAFLSLCGSHWYYYRYRAPNQIRYKPLYESIFSLFSISPQSIYRPADGNEIPNWRINLLAFFFPLIISTVQYLFCVAIGDLGFNKPIFLERIASTFGMSYNASIQQSSAASSKVAFSGWIYTFFLGWIWDLFPTPSTNWGSGTAPDGSALFNGCSWVILAAVEEIGWMGILFPCLLCIWKGNFIKSSIVTGIIWSSWHWGFIILGGVNALPAGAGYQPGSATTEWTYAWIMFIVTIVSLRILICRLTLYTRSLYTAILMHAVHNVWVISFYAQISFETKRPGRYEIGESGFIVVIFYSLAAARIIYTIWQSTKAVAEEEQQRQQEQQQQDDHQQDDNDALHDGSDAESEDTRNKGNGLAVPKLNGANDRSTPSADVEHVNGDASQIIGLGADSGGAAGLQTVQVQVHPAALAISTLDQRRSSSPDITPRTPLNRPPTSSNAAAPTPPLPILFDDNVLVPLHRHCDASADTQRQTYEPPKEKELTTMSERNRATQEEESKEKEPKTSPVASMGQIKAKSHVKQPIAVVPGSPAASPSSSPPSAAPSPLATVANAAVNGLLSLIHSSPASAPITATEREVELISHSPLNLNNSNPRSRRQLAPAHTPRERSIARSASPRDRRTVSIVAFV